MKTITFVSQKGGTAKTTSAAAIGSKLHQDGYRVLFVDTDPQGNLSYTLGAQFGKCSITDLLQQALENPENVKTQDAIQYTAQGHVIVSSPAAAEADTVLADVIGKEYKLREILEPVRMNYDFCIIDTAPTVGTLAINALAASDIAVAPAQADVYSLTGIRQLYGTIATVKKYCNPQLTFKGIFLTRYNPRTTLSRELTEHIAEDAAKNGTQLFNTKIRECVAVREAAIMQQSIYTYSPKCNAAKDYAALLEEILK